MKTKNKVSSSVGDRNKRVRNSDQGIASPRSSLSITLMVQPFSYALKIRFFTNELTSVDVALIMHSDVLWICHFKKKLSLYRVRNYYEQRMRLCRVLYINHFQ